MAETKPISPFTKGINNVSPLRSKHFQPSEGGAFLRDAVNVDIDSTGVVTRRSGYTKIVEAPACHSGFAFGDFMYLVSNGSLFSYDPVTGNMLNLCMGVGANPVSFADVGDAVYWMNDLKSGVIRNGVNYTWGIPSAIPPILDPDAGTLRAGRYLVGVTYTKNGVESGCVGVSTITLLEPSGISITPEFIPPDIDRINVYCSDCNGADAYFIYDCEASEPVFVHEVETSASILDSVGLYPPPMGHLIFHYRGYLFVCTQDGFYWSQPLDYHRFYLSTDFQMTSAKPVMAIALETGFYLALADGQTLWISGDSPDEWQPTVVDTARVIDSQALLIPARVFPSLQLPMSAKVGVWVSTEGVVIGTPTGSIIHPSRDVLSIDQFERASLAYMEGEGSRKVLMSLRNKLKENEFGIGDRVTASVIKAGGTPD